MKKLMKSDKRKPPYDLLKTTKENRRHNMELLVIKELNGGISTTKTVTERVNTRGNPISPRAHDNPIQVT